MTKVNLDDVVDSDKIVLEYEYWDLSESTWLVSNVETLLRDGEGMWYEMYDDCGNRFIDDGVVDMLEWDINHIDWKSGYNKNGRIIFSKPTGDKVVRV